MLRRTIFCALIFLALSAFFAVNETKAQTVWGISGYQVDQNTHQLYGYHSTEVDYWAYQYYDVYVEGRIYNQNNQVLDFDSDEDYFMKAEAYTQVTYTPGQTYYVISDHWLIAYVWVPTGGGGGSYWNPYGYGFGSPGGYGGFFGFSPGQSGYSYSQYIYLGWTGWELYFFREPHIDTMVPTSAPLGTSIEVNFSGTSFGTNPTINVSGSGISVGNPTFSTDTRLTAIFTIADNASTGNHTVSITTSEGMTSNSKTLNVGDRTPVINNINPSSGDAGEIVPVTINGTGFGTTPIVDVTGGINVQVTSRNNTQITANFTIPLTTTPGNHQVRVTSNGNGSGFIGGQSPTSAPVNFTVNAHLPPIITNYAPQSGPLGSSIEINVVGQNFTNTRTLQISGQGVTVQSYTPVDDPDHQIVAILNIAENAQPGNRSITVSAGGLTSNSVNFQVGDRSPHITAINPPSGNRGTTTPVVVTGTGFGSNPTLQISGADINVTVQSKSDTRIEATFVISAAAAPLTRTVTVTSQGVAGSGFIQTPGTTPTATVPFDIKKSKVKIDAMDDQFAPSVERLGITYSITPLGTTAPFARLQIFKKGDNNNPIFVDNNITKTGISIPYIQDGAQGWDGKANAGPDAGKFIGPEGSPYKVRISIDDNANFNHNISDSDSFKIEMFIEVSMPPAPPKPGESPEPGTDEKEYTVVKPWNPTVAVTELDTPITVKVLYKSKNPNVKLGTAIPYKVDWSFTDPDDTSDDKDVDGNLKGGDDNALVANGGKRPAAGQTSAMWKAVAGFSTLLNPQGQIATSDMATIPGPDIGTTKIKFSSSAIGGDNYELIGSLKNDGGQVVKDIKFKKWSVRKALDFSAAYQMDGGADLDDYVKADRVKGAFEGDGYTDYKLQGGIKPYPAPTPGPSPSPSPSPSNYLAPLLEPLPLLLPNGNPNPATELPTAPELAAFAGPPGQAQAAAATAITTKAQTWMARNVQRILQEEDAILARLNITAATMIGAKSQHPKYDGLKGDGRAANAPKFYPDGIVIHDVDEVTLVPIPNSPPIDPNLDWTQAPGDTGTPNQIGGLEYDYPVTIAGNQTTVKVAFFFRILQQLPGFADFYDKQRKIAGRHELGHASDHILFGPATELDPHQKDHWLKGLMHKHADGTTTSPGDENFAADSILRLRGWKR